MRRIVAVGCLIAATACRPEPEPVARCGGVPTDLNGDPRNCSACGMTCAVAHGQATCVRGRCGGACEPGWGTCAPSPPSPTPTVACDVDLRVDPRACGACGVRCVGTPCVDGVCRRPPVVVATAKSGRGIVGHTLDSLILGPVGDVWTFVLLFGGSSWGARLSSEAFAPLAIDGDAHVGCAWTALPTAPCVLLRRRPRGPEMSLATLVDLHRTTLAVRDETVYWARAPLGKPAAIVATSLGDKSERVLATNEAAPHRLVVDETHVFWVSDQDGGALRRVARSGGSVELLARVAGVRSVALADTRVVVASDQGLHVVPKGGGPPRLLLTSAPVDAGTASITGVELVGESVYWSVEDPRTGHLTILQNDLPP